MRDVAAAAGVSSKTVSRVLNSDPHVHPSTRARVEAMMRELDYVPNSLATTFRSGRSSVIGVAVPDIVDPFFASIVRAVEHVALARDMSTLVTSLGEDPARERLILESMLRGQPSGIVVAPISGDQRFLAAWSLRLPIVFVDRPPLGLSADSFTQDNFAGAFTATMHLVEHGHDRIGFLGDTVTVPTTAARLHGYRSALQAAGLSADDELIAMGAGTRASAASALQTLRGLARPATAIFSSNARCTMALLPLADPMSIVTFGDFPLADVLRPSLTVMAQDPSELGRLAAHRILDRLDHPNRRFHRSTVLPVHLVERESCGVPEDPADRAPVTPPTATRSQTDGASLLV
ncbi:MAG: LacI family DNA-binding transcriptional regulator [Leifsonia flava]